MSAARKLTDHIRLERDFLESVAYRSLNPVARSLLTEFWIIAYPSRNGHLVMPTKRAATRVNVSEPTVIKAFRDLERNGFIVQTEEHCYSIGRAKTWRLTTVKCNQREATHDWRNLEHQAKTGS